MSGEGCERRKQAKGRGGMEGVEKKLELNLASEIFFLFFLIQTPKQKLLFCFVLFCFFLGGGVCCFWLDGDSDRRVAPKRNMP